MIFFRKLASRCSLAGLPSVATARLRIAPLVDADTEAVRALTDDPAIVGAVDFLPEPFTLEDARRLIGTEKATANRFLGARDASGELVGIVGIHLRGEQAVEIGYWIGGAFRGQGLGAEFVAAIVALLRRSPRRLIVTGCGPENTASCGLLRKAGFRDTGDEGHRPGRRIYVIEPS